MTPEQQDSLQKQKMWRLLTGEQQRQEQEYEEYYRRNPPPQLRPVWQQALIVGVPVVMLIAIVCSI